MFLTSIKRLFCKRTKKSLLQKSWNEKRNNLDRQTDKSEELGEKGEVINKIKQDQKNPICSKW
jgi:hypothetical protein